MRNAGYVYRARVKACEAGWTVLDWHARRYPHSTSEEWLARIRAGRVLRAGRPLAEDEIVRADDLLEWHRPAWDEEDVPAEVAVAFEDEHLLVVDKPAGLQTMPAGGFLERTLLGVVRGMGTPEWTPVHRLGRGTSGLVLCAKTPLARTHLAAQFRERTPGKLYHALVEGVPSRDGSCVRHRLGPVAHEGATVVSVSPAGKPALTLVRVVWRDVARGQSLVLAKPVTGRADQIRSHLAAVGHPIVGDPLFGPGATLRAGARPGNIGYLLRAIRLRFLHPATGARMIVAADAASWADRPTGA